MRVCVHVGVEAQVVHDRHDAQQPAQPVHRAEVGGGGGVGRAGTEDLADRLAAEEQCGARAHLAAQRHRQLRQRERVELEVDLRRGKVKSRRAESGQKGVDAMCE